MNHPGKAILTPFWQLDEKQKHRLVLGRSQPVLSFLIVKNRLVQVEQRLEQTAVGEDEIVFGQPAFSGENRRGQEMVLPQGRFMFRA